jgi:uncharacterized repeat protein (TIGR03837 family)
MFWDIFCTVVDHYGDIGVSWRLARQLHAEHGQRVRLWVDDLASFQRLQPEIDPVADSQLCQGVEVRRWTSPFPRVSPADIVIEAFGCALPDSFLADMAAHTPRPCWINLEHLSAEPWVEDCHRLPSPQPRLGLEKYFFFPGFTERTGGLPREGALAGRRDTFQSDPATQDDFWKALGLRPRQEPETRISLFCYDHAPVASLLDALTLEDAPNVCLIAEGPAAHLAAGWMGWQDAAPGRHGSRGSLSVHVLPFLDQDRYDRLLWACDLNFVRGEDSFLRAQWAARPLVWHIYGQQDGAHWKKLDAFLNRYVRDLPAPESDTMRAFWAAWNAGGDVAEAWPAFRSSLAQYGEHARHWFDRLAQTEDLAAQLLAFCRAGRV